MCAKPYLAILIVPMPAEIGKAASFVPLLMHRKEGKVRERERESVRP